MARRETELIRPLLLTPEDVAAALSWGRTKTYRLIHQGTIPSVLVGGSRRILARDLEAYVERLRHDESN